jgi:hypothetical protein
MTLTRHDGAQATICLLALSTATAVPHYFDVVSIISPIVHGGFRFWLVQVKGEGASGAGQPTRCGRASEKENWTYLYNKEHNAQRGPLGEGRGGRGLEKLELDAERDESPAGTTTFVSQRHR